MSVSLPGEFLWDGFFFFQMVINNFFLGFYELYIGTMSSKWVKAYGLFNCNYAINTIFVITGHLQKFPITK